MDSDTILSFRSPHSDRDAVDAAPSPALELTYAHYYLEARAPRVARAERLPWALEFERDEPELVDALRELWPPDAPPILLAIMACEFGYVDDDDPARFLGDLPELPERLVERIRDHVPDDEAEAEELIAWRASVRRAAEQLTAPERGAFSEHLQRLWAWLEGRWRDEGAGLVEAACATFRSKFEASGDVLQALPAHHFVQFEKAAAQIRASQKQRRVRVVPLYFAGDGGMNLELSHSHTIGFGLQSEQLFEATSARVRDLAHAAKAFADPTRLMMLALIARYGKFALTVGDLAAQLEVSQPTVSGHLKLLREMGFVELSKRGTKSYYHLAEPELRAALDGVAELLLD